MEAGVSTVAIVVRLAKVVELVLADLGLTLNQYRALTLIESDPPPMGEFAFRLAMEPPNASALMDGLVARSLASRGRDRADRRRVVLRLTARGRTLLDRAEARCRGALARVAEFDPAQSQALIAGLESWGDALDHVAVDLRRRLDQVAVADPRSRAGRNRPSATTTSRRAMTGGRDRPAARDVPVRRSLAALVSGDRDRGIERERLGPQSKTR